MEIISNVIGTILGGGIVWALFSRLIKGYDEKFIIAQTNIDTLKTDTNKSIERVEDENKNIVENYNKKFERVYDKIDKTNENISNFKNEVIESVTRIETKLDQKPNTRKRK